jgi:spoIIIJ-associated protein
MIDEGELEIIGEHVRHLLGRMGFSEAAIRCQNVPPYLYIHITVGSSGKLLIGAKGAHLAALQHILRLVMRDTLPADTRLVVDVNSYRARREQDLLKIACRQ